MNRHLRAVLTAVLPAALLAGCTDFLKCSECTRSPNSPTDATAAQRLVAVQANMWEGLNGDLSRLVAMWMQGMAGTDRQFAALGTYVVSESDYDGEFSRAYGGAGLIDLRAIQAEAESKGDKVTQGIAQIMEAWWIGTIADIWGDIPYSEAAQPDKFPTPKYDTQQAVYESLQALLTTAINNVGGGGAGPGPAELVYKGDPVKWAALAHTLKARLYLHTAERDPSAYGKALAEAQMGIASNAGDYVIPYQKTTGEDNNWYQFMVVQRAGYISAGAHLVNLLKNAGDPRLGDFYEAGDTTEVVGATPGQPVKGWMATLNSATRGGQDYKQPMVTYNENQLIIAEALYRTGKEPEALTALNAEINSWKTATAWHDALTVPTKAGLSGPALLNAIMTEKYIALFQNVEVWNDYKRTCIPALTPAGGKTAIPGRLPYGVTERQTNGDNVPANPTRNWNDPNAC